MHSLESSVPKVAIAGAGMTGSYLHRLFANCGIESDIYDDNLGHASCGINPCAWGATSAFREHVEVAGFDPEQYVLKDFDTINFEGVDMEAHLLTFDKPRLLTDLRRGARVRQGRIPEGRYERVVDATGHRRAYLPNVREDLLVPCVQYRVRMENADDSRITILYGNLGYSWIFPLSNGEYHIGAGSILADPRDTLKSSGFLGPDSHILCGCLGKVKATSPIGSRPFVWKDVAMKHEIWGVGESIGVVAPIAGEGVVPGMASARLLVDHWQDPKAYSSAILKEFSWMMDERKVIKKVLDGAPLGMRDWITLRRTGRRMGSHVTMAQTRELLKCLNKTNSETHQLANLPAEGCAR